jgi:hypothetical protein
MNYIKNDPCKKILATIDKSYDSGTDEYADILTYDFSNESYQYPDSTLTSITKHKQFMVLWF